jgi:hypothetical protein
MRAAKSRAASTLATGSAVRFMTSAGTRTLGRMSRISIMPSMRSRAAKAAGLADALRYRMENLTDARSLGRPAPGPVRYSSVTPFSAR